MGSKVFNEWFKPIFSGVVIAVITWVLKEFWGYKEMNQHIISFFVTFSPVIIGLFTFFLYWIIADYIKLRRFSNDLKKWIRYFSYPDGKGGYLYTDLKGKIKRYIQEELEILDEKIGEIVEEKIIEKRLNDNDPDALKAFLDKLKSKNS
ncbi:MAG: hypothetical protein ABSH06_12875 [Thermodesulfobacteriota bacterium]